MKWRYIGFRFAWTVFAAWLFMTGMFLFFAVTLDPNAALIGFLAGGGEASREAVQAYLDARGRDIPLTAQYVDLIVSFLTLEFGHSFFYETSVSTVLARRIPRTLAYVIPGIILSGVLSVGFGTVAALRGGVSDTVGRLGGVLAFSLPAFLLAVAFRRLARTSDLGFDVFFGFATDLPLTAPSNLLVLIPPALIVAVNLYGAQLVWVRTETREIAAQEFVKTLRANGVASRRVISHILKNAASPLFAVAVSEVLVVLFVTVFVVEIVLGIPGVASAYYAGFFDRDLNLVQTITVLLVTTALAANFLQDVASAAIDPRLAGGEK